MTGKAAGHLDHESGNAAPHAGTVNPDALEVAPGVAHENLEGWIPQLATEDELRVPPSRKPSTTAATSRSPAKTDPKSKDTSLTGAPRKR